MAISSYPRTIQNGQIATNGNANAGTGLMLWDSATNTYIAATPSTFSGGGGGATAANQATQIAIENTLSTKALQTSQAAALAAETNGGVLTDNCYNITLATGANNLTGTSCKYVTLINASTNAKMQFNTSTSPNFINLEAGYSVRINVTNAGNVSVKQTTGENNVLDYIITS